MSRRLTVAAACICIAALPLAGCGSSKKKGIPRANVAELVGLLKDARRQAAAKTPGECNALFTTIQGLSQRANALPTDVDSNVKDSLTNGIGNLQNLAAKQCSQTQTTTTQTQTTPTQTTPTQTTPTQTTPTQTTPTQTTPTQTTPTTTTPPSGGTTAPGTPTPP